MKEKLLQWARNKKRQKLLGFFFAHLSFLLPYRRMFNTRRVIAFNHPTPRWKNHVLIIPKKAIVDLLDLATVKNWKYFRDILKAASKVEYKSMKFRNGFVLIGNGGNRQETPQVHFHMFTDPTFKMSTHPKNKVIHDYKTLRCCYYSVPATKNFALVPKKRVNMVDNIIDNEQMIKDIYQCINDLEKQFNLSQKGYSLVIGQYIKKGKRTLTMNITAE